MSKREKLDTVVAEVGKLKNAVKKLYKQQLLLTDEIAKIVRGPVTNKPKRSAQAKPKASPRAVRPTGDAKRPVLLQTPTTASHQKGSSSSAG